MLWRPEVHSRGLATSLLQDAVEVFLWLVAERKRIDVREYENFPSLLDKVRERFDCVSAHSAALRRLNKARVAFKHQGLSVSTPTEVQGFVANVEDFLTEVSSSLFDVDFASLSLIDAIGHMRTQNWLHKAESALESQLHSDAIAHASRALDIYLAHSESQNAALLGELVEPYFDTGETGRLVDWIVEYIEPIRIRLDLFARGIDVAAYDRFRVLAPLYHPNVAGVSDDSTAPIGEPTWEDVRFCIDFVVDSTLAIRDSRTGRPHRDVTDGGRALVKTRCEIVVNPTSGSPEVIRMAEPNERLFVTSEPRNPWHRHPHRGFVAITQDGDVAYVRRECVEIIAAAAESAARPSDASTLRL